MPILRRMEAVIAATLTLVAAALCVFIPELIAEGGISAAQDFITLSPVFFPRLAFGLLTVLSFGYFVIAYRQSATAPAGSSVADTSKYRRVLVIYVFALAYPFLLPWLGFGVSTILLLAGMTIFLGNRSWWQVALFAVLTPVAVRFIFERLLAISLPRADIEWIDDIEELVMRSLVKIFFHG